MKTSNSNKLFKIATPPNISPETQKISQITNQASAKPKAILWKKAQSTLTNQNSWTWTAETAKYTQILIFKITIGTVWPKKFRINMCQTILSNLR